MNAPKRRWFRFSLRTMLVVVTVFGCWLGYNLNWIRQRHEFIEEQSAIHRELPRRGPAPIFSSLGTLTFAQPVAQAPGTLWMFGETGKPLLDVVARNPADIKAVQERAASLFPEVTVIQPDGEYMPDWSPTTVATPPRS